MEIDILKNQCRRSRPTRRHPEAVAGATRPVPRSLL